MDLASSPQLMPAGVSTTPADDSAPPPATVRADGAWVALPTCQPGIKQINHSRNEMLKSPPTG